MTKKKEPVGLQHVGLERRLVNGLRWQELTAPEKLLYIRLKANHDGSNNGRIRLSYRSMEHEKGCSSSTAISKAIKGLQKKGWIKVRESGGLYRHDNFYELTFKWDFYGVPKPYSKHRNKDKL